jgi:hypothetical protein
VQVLLIPVGGEPVVGDIPTSTKGGFKAISEWVGGGICSNDISERPHLEILCNDDGLELGLPYNRAGHVGQLVIARYDAEGYQESMTGLDCALARDWLARNDQRPPLCHVCGGPGANITYFCFCRDVLVFCLDCEKRRGLVMATGEWEEQERYGMCAKCRQKPAGSTRPVIWLGRDQPGDPLRVTGAGRNRPGASAMNDKEIRRQLDEAKATGRDPGPPFLEAQVLAEVKRWQRDDNWRGSVIEAWIEMIQSGLESDDDMILFGIKGLAEYSPEEVLKVLQNEGLVEGYGEDEDDD